MVTDSEGKITLFNPAAERIMGIPAKKVLGKKAVDVIENSRIDVVLETGQAELNQVQDVGDVKIVTNRVPITDGQDVVGVVATFLDVGYIQKATDEIRRSQYKKGFKAKATFRDIIYKDHKMGSVIQRAIRYAHSDLSVLITGESGVGKELFAQSIHNESPRRTGPFVAVNCAALSESLLESELFGYEGGAFTGAEKKGKPGKFALAHGGTLFLDEISELNLDLQVKLLRVLQEQVYYPVGGTKPCSVDVRIIAATNKDLAQLVEEGRFREDLYYRLNVVSLHLPPLRERKKDIPELAYYFLAEFAAAYQKKVSDIDPAVMTFFLRYHWPGNVRELRNIIERMVVLTEGDCLTMETMPPELKHNKANFRDLLTSARSLSESKCILEKELIVNTLAECGGNKARAALRLGVPRSSLYYRIKKLGIQEQEYLQPDGGY